MPWVRVDDHFNEHPKHALAGPLCWALWLAGLAYSNRNLTDGFIPWAIARKLVSWTFLDQPDEEGRQRKVTISVTSGMSGEDVTSEMIIQRLLTSELWKECKGGYKIHDYPDYQPSRKDVLSQREQNAIRQARHRVRNAVTDGVSHDNSNAANNAPVTTPPYPYPYPNPNTEEKTKTLAPKSARGSVSLNGFDAFWTTYPRKKSKGQAEKAWKALQPSEQLQAEILAAIKRATTSADWLKDNGAFIPYPATWLNAKGWADEVKHATGSRPVVREGWKDVTPGEVKL